MTATSVASPSSTEDADPDWEYRPLRLPPGVSRLTAAMQLAINAEISGWELAHVLLYSDGTRKVWLRRRRRHAALGELIT